MMTKKKRMTLIISIIVAVIIIIAAILGILYIKTDIFKSNKTLFLKYLGKNAENIGNLQSIVQLNEYENSLQNSPYKTNTQIKANYTKNVGTTSENNDNSINKLTLNIDGQTDKANNYDNQKIELKNQDNTEATITYTRNNDSYGLLFNDLFNKYVVANNSNLKDLAKKLGFSDEQINNIPDNINVDENILNDLKFSDDELNTLKTKYSSIVIGNVDSNKFGKQSSVGISINNQNMVAKAYSMTLTKEELNNIYVKILDTIKNDEVILGKIDKIQNIYNEITLGNNNINIKEKIQQKIESKIQNINQNNIGSEQTKITVYEVNGKTIKTEIQGDSYKISLDCIENNEKYFNAKITKSDKTEESVTITGTSDKVNIGVNKSTDDVTKQLNFERTVEVNDSKETVKNTLAYEDNTKKAELAVNQNIEKTTDIKEKVEFNNDNSVNLTTLDQDQAKNIYDTVQNGINNKKAQVEDDIQIESIESMLQELGLIKDTSVLNSTEITDAERNRFNSKFEIIQGEKMKSEDVVKMIESIKDNITNMQVISNDELKLEVDRKQGNSQIVNSLFNYLDKSQDEYNIKIEYDENQLAKYIDLTIVKKD